jgi:hypothetical protein
MPLSLLIPALLLQAAAPAQDAEQAYRDRFDTALIEICPEAVRTGGALLRDPARLGPSGFTLVSDQGGATIARAIDIEVAYMHGQAVCHLQPVARDAAADARFTARWTDFAKRNYPAVDFARELAAPQWLPRPIHVTDAPGGGFLMIMGHVSARGSIPEVYVISVMAPPRK